MKFHHIIRIGVLTLKAIHFVWLWLLSFGGVIAYQCRLIELLDVRVFQVDLVGVMDVNIGEITRRALLEIHVSVDIDDNSNRILRPAEIVQHVNEDELAEHH